MHVPQPYSSPHAKCLCTAILGGAYATPASAFTREQRMLARYYNLLYATTTDAEALMNTIWGPNLTRKQMYGDKATDGKIDRLDHSVPDLIRILLPEEQEPVEELLNAGDLVGTIRHLLLQERTFLTREFPTKAPNDSGHARAAGLGHLSSVNYGRRNPQHLRFPPAAATEPVTPDTPPAATPQPAHPTPPQQLRPRHRPLQPQPNASTYTQVKKAQERKRLKRKRRH